MTSIRETFASQSYDIDPQGYMMEASNSSIPGFKETTNFNRIHYSNNPKKKKEKRTISRFFSDMSRFGMSYDEDVLKNMRAIPADKSLLPKDQQIQNQDLFANVLSNWKQKSNADKNFFEKDFQQKREALRQLAAQPELEDILDTMSNESIVYDTDYTYFCEPMIEPQELRDVKKDKKNEIFESMSSHFRRFYKMLNWKYNAWDDFKRWLVEGILAWEIVYDSLELDIKKDKKGPTIIGLVPLDPATLTKKFDNGKWYWIQFKGVQGKERKLTDA